VGAFLRPVCSRGGTVREHPSSKVCWLANDNLLVAHALGRIWAMQVPNGGITTDYDREGRPVGTQNVETIAFVMLVFSRTLAKNEK